MALRGCNGAGGGAQDAGRVERSRRPGVREVARHPAPSDRSGTILARAAERASGEVVVGKQVEAKSAGACKVAIEPLSDAETSDLVEDLNEELEDFAFERERVLAKLDMRAAALARRIARELRVVLRGLPMSLGDEARASVHETLGGLLEEAHRLLDTIDDDDRAAGPESAALESGERPIVPEDRDPTIASLPSMLDADERSGFDDETIARKVVWARSGNRILGG
jgi:hypothetical protein